MDNLYKIDESYYYVYEHWLDGEIIYVGKGKGVRAYDFSRNRNWVKRVDGREESVKVVISAYFKREQQAFDFEETTIIELIMEGVNLTNITHNKNRSPNYPLRSYLSKKRKISKIMKDGSLEGSYTPFDKASVKSLIEIGSFNQVLSFIKSHHVKDYRDKFIVFSRRRKEITKKLISKGLRVLELPTLSKNIGYQDIDLLRDYKRLLSTGVIPEPYNALVLSPSSMGNVKITDNLIKLVVIDTFNDKDYKDSVGSMGVKFPILVNKVNYSVNFGYVDFPTEYINTPLITSVKKELCERFNLRNQNGRLLLWPSVVKVLKSQGLLVEDKNISIEGKSTRVSIVNLVEHA